MTTRDIAEVAMRMQVLSFVAYVVATMKQKNAHAKTVISAATWIFSVLTVISLVEIFWEILDTIGSIL